MPPKKRGKPVTETELASSSTAIDTRRSKVVANATSGTSAARTTRASAAAAAKNKNTPTIITSSVAVADPVATTNGKRKRVSSTAKSVTVSDHSDCEEPAAIKPRNATIVRPVSKPAAKAPAKASVKNTVSPREAPAKTQPKKATVKTSKDKTPLNKFSIKRCEEWFLQYADDDGSEINGGTIGNLIEDLEVDSEGVALYCLLWNFKASSTMTITKDEFTRQMKIWQTDSNEKFKSKLPSLMQQICPRPISERPENPLFLDFYKWCFGHFKATEQAKNITIDVAEVLFQALLDDQKYQIEWKPSDTSKITGGNAHRLNHVDTFVEYLKGEPKPVAVITKDQYEQFYHFNKDVPWDLKGYSELTSTWPTLMDNYISWKKEQYPTED